MIFKTTTRAMRRLGTVLFVLITGAASLAQAQSHSRFRIVWDNFRDGFTVGTPDAKWFYVADDPLPSASLANDGRVTTSLHGLNVVSSGINPTTGRPAFTRTIAQEDDNPLGIHGQRDHAKWFVYMNHRSSRGTPGFDALSGHVLSFQARISGQTFGTGGHPFGSSVSDEHDLRLAATAMSVFDFETELAFDFYLTNRLIYAVYARLPFARDRLGNYAAFVFAVPAAVRLPREWHRLKITYDKDAGTVCWFVDGNEVLRVNRIGHRIDRQYMLIDHGGDETEVSPHQLDGRMGALTLLDGGLPLQPGLARLSNLPFFYFDTERGAPIPQPFIDNDSNNGSRLFGQGTELRVRRYVVSSHRAHRD